MRGQCRLSISALMSQSLHHPIHLLPKLSDLDDVEGYLQSFKVLAGRMDLLEVLKLEAKERAAKTHLEW